MGENVVTPFDSLSKSETEEDHEDPRSVDLRPLSLAALGAERNQPHSIMRIGVLVGGF